LETIDDYDTESKEPSTLETIDSNYLTKLRVANSTIKRRFIATRNLSLSFIVSRDYNKFWMSYWIFIGWRSYP